MVQQVGRPGRSLPVAARSSPDAGPPRRPWRQRALVASSVTLRRRRRRRPRSGGSCRSPPGVSWLGRRLSTTATRARRTLAWSPRIGVAPVEARPGPRWQVGPAASAVTRSASASQSAAMSTTRRTLPLVSPLRQSRPRDREEVDIAGRDRRVERLAIHPRQHQDRPVASVSHDGRGEAVGAEADRGRIDHAAIAGPTGRPPPLPP